MGDKTYELTKQEIELMEKVLSKGNRVEIIPVKDGVKIVQVKRESANALEKYKK